MNNELTKLLATIREAQEYGHECRRTLTSRCGTCEILRAATAFKKAARLYSALAKAEGKP